MIDIYILSFAALVCAIIALVKRDSKVVSAVQVVQEHATQMLQVIIVTMMITIKVAMAVRVAMAAMVTMEVKVQMAKPTRLL